MNKSYDKAKVNILSMDTLPSVNKVYNMLQHIEKHNLIINSQLVEMSAFYSVRDSQIASKFAPGSQSKDFKDSKKTKPDRFCNFCKMKGHI